MVSQEVEMRWTASPLGSKDVGGRVIISPGSSVPCVQRGRAMAGASSSCSVKVPRWWDLLMVLSLLVSGGAYKGFKWRSAQTGVPFKLYASMRESTTTSLQGEFPAACMSDLHQPKERLTKSADIVASVCHQSVSFPT